MDTCLGVAPLGLEAGKRSPEEDGVPALVAGISPCSVMKTRACGVDSTVYPGTMQSPQRDEQPHTYPKASHWPFSQ